MNTNERKAHWEKVFETKDTTKVGWYQPIPETSIRLIKKLNIDKTSKIIEVGCGDSFLSDFLIENGYWGITLLDISAKALEIIKYRLGEKAKVLSFLAADVTEFSTAEKYNLWHDRAVFHFLTNENDRNKYINNASEKLVSGGYLVLGTFSHDGPDMCSGLNVKQYSEEEITEIFSSNFRKIECFTENHQTPSGKSQNFLFSIFQRI